MTSTEPPDAASAHAPDADAEIADADLPLADGTTCNAENSPETVRLQVLQEEHLSQIAELFSEAFASKRFMLCFSMAESAKDIKTRYAHYPKEKWNLGVVALSRNPESGEDQVLGFCQMATNDLPMYPSGMHHCDPGEWYIETIAVAEEARGQGIGSKLMKWSEDYALVGGASKLTLEVLQGNPAVSLYERCGFVIRQKGDVVEACCEAVAVCCVFGRPYGCCHPSWGTYVMEKQLR
jgi:ribosomal protein S18 acetylase RimI-like enzyme